MTTKVVDFLSESGGSNFTETAPRPPTYGEENELQSNGGNSTKSSGSQKSHGSSKSHSSSRSTASTRGEHTRSPATTPRKSNLEVCKTQDAAAGFAQAGCCAGEEGEVAAPLGFEPEGSTANSPPYSENGTPPHVKWRESLTYLLADSEGVVLFRGFMENELSGGSEELLFWFACQGFKRKVSCEESSVECITNLQKAIYKRYIRSDKVKCISKEVKKEIAEKITGRNTPDPCIFDAAQEEVEHFMRSEMYPAFLQSHHYLEYVQNYVDSPKSSHSSGSSSARPVSQTGLLPVVHEDKELEDEDFEISMALPVISKVTPTMKKTEISASVRHTETFTGSALYCSRPAPYPGYVSYAPVSAQDSELQSLSSDALTDDTVSVTDSSVALLSLGIRKKSAELDLESGVDRAHWMSDVVPGTRQPELRRSATSSIQLLEISGADCKSIISPSTHIKMVNAKVLLACGSTGLLCKLHYLQNFVSSENLEEGSYRSWDGYSQRLASKKHHRKAVMKTLASHNREFPTGLHSQIIPRTEYAPKDRNLAETDPKQFAGLLIEKLNKVVVEWENIAKMEEKLRSINSSQMDRAENEEQHLSCVTTKPSTSFIPLPSSIEEETAESILDQHCSRIWESSAHHSPSYSPPRSPPHRSPDRHKEARKKAALPAAVSAPAAYITRGGHKKRDFVTYDPEDHNLILCGTETHRHIHHHHHHHHSSRDASFKKTHVELESQTCGASSWRTENGQNLSADFPGGDHAGRGRVSARKNGSSVVRRSLETSSNVDSGISLMGSVKVTPNWSNPTSEKVMKWMLDSETVQEVSLQVQETDKSSSTHRRSHRFNQSTGSSQQTRSSSKSKTSIRSTSVERSGGILSAWSGTAAVMPNQPFAQDPSMPLPTPPNPITQLEEAKRRLQTRQTQSRTAGGTTSSPVKSKSFASAPAKDKMRLPPGGISVPSTSHTRTLQTAKTAPAHLDTSATNQMFHSRLGQRVPASSSLQQSPSETIIGIYMGQEPIPYRHQLPGRSITLAQIKTLITKRGTFKYYFKSHSDEFGDGAGAVFEEIKDDNSIVPMWQGKIVVKVEKLDL